VSDRVLTLSVAGAAALFLVRDHLSVPFDASFQAVAQARGVPSHLLKAIARVESGFKVAARNTRNDPGEGDDVGLMQINVRTARALRRDVARLATDAAYSIDTAAELLVALKRELGDKFSLLTWAAAYNAGAPAIRRRGVFNDAYASRVLWHSMLYQLADLTKGRG
jgi:soluble lytic murein transglycosylase-like protein